ncbi:MAG: hypothetical protein GVY32_01455 [Gammaproteobacteria bacterium]|jgi:hypothetical protein|nr:hypothetical protein [Gammaproteobacteria bacterium]
MKPLTQLINDLSADPDLEAAYRKDARAVASRYGLDQEETDALVSGDIERIRKACGLKEIHLTNGTVRRHEG